MAAGFLFLWRRTEDGLPSPVPCPLCPVLILPSHPGCLCSCTHRPIRGVHTMETAREKKTTARALPLPSQSARWGALSKRLFDIIVAALGLLILSSVFSLLSYLIQRESPGPAFYRGPRLGKGGKPFGILKFRTMYERPSSYAGPRLTVQGDGRITPLGQWLRDTKLNELPQLWNVLVGEMSLVGPRPEDPEIARSWPLKAKEEMLSVQPG